MRLGALPVLALLAACAAEKAPAPEPTETALPAEPRTLVPADLDLATLGARVAEMAVTDAALGGGEAPFARLSAYVACPKEMTACDPAQLPAGTRYTYVLTVTPAPAPVPKGEAAPTPPPVPLVMPSPPTFATTQPAPGFEGGVGYALAEAAAALGAEDGLSITLDEGRIVWRAAEKARWQAGLPVTFWWQSTRPPEMRRNAYSFASGTDSATVRAPFPTADKPVERESAR